MRHNAIFPSRSEDVRRDMHPFQGWAVRQQACYRRGARQVTNKEEPVVFTIDFDKDGYRARLWSGSDLIWWTEGYTRKEGALNAIRIAKASHAAPVLDRAKAA